MDYARAGGSATGVRKYRHNSVTAPDTTSKNFARKQAAKMKAERLEAKKNGVKFKESSIKPIVKANTPSKPKPELKTSTQIAKERALKEKRREKTGRHANSAVKAKSRRGGKGMRK